jgi:anti-sigma regulatory factor (Ser/Thr protein kinase)
MQSVDHSLSETYPAEPPSVVKARAALSQFAAAAGATRRQINDVRLATSEAVTNSVLHAYRGQPGSIYVTAAAACGELWILVADDGCGLEPRSDRPGLGLGLGLISQVSDDLEIAPRASGGTELRMSFRLVGANRPAGAKRSAGVRKPGWGCGTSDLGPGRSLGRRRSS